MNNRVKYALSFIAAFAVAGSSLAQGWGSRWRNDDDSPVFLLKYTGAGLATATVNKTTITLTHDGMAAKSMVLTNAANFFTFVTARSVNTNPTGRTVWDIEKYNVLDADSVSNSFVSLTNVMTPFAWNEDALVWDTDGIDHWDVTINSQVGDSPLGGRNVTGIQGYPDGTGNVTVVIYENQVRKYQTVITSPVYVNPATESHVAASITTNGVINAVNLEGINLGAGVRIGQGVIGFMRVTRATGAAPGGVGVTWQE